MIDKALTIMGVVNVTPDSFSDGGQWVDPELAWSRGVELAEAGADVIDLGAESSRPGASEVPLDKEWARLEPVLELFRKRNPNIAVSVDTYKPEIMLMAAELGAQVINDIKGGADESTLKLLAQKGVTYLAMHMHRSPLSMQQSPLSANDALDVVADFYDETYHKLKRCGFSEDKILLDPGIGFGKSDAANFQLIAQAMQKSSQYPILLGISRKSFIGRALDLPDPLTRDLPSKMMEMTLILSGIKAIRTHEVKALHQVRRQVLHS